MWLTRCLISTIKFSMLSSDSPKVEKCVWLVEKCVWLDVRLTRCRYVQLSVTAVYDSGVRMASEFFSDTVSRIALQISTTTTIVLVWHALVEVDSVVQDVHVCAKTL